jgi:hypothetical protein
VGFKLKGEVILPGKSLGETREKQQNSSVQIAVVNVEVLNWVSGCAD